MTIDQHEGPAKRYATRGATRRVRAAPPGTRAKLPALWLLLGVAACRAEVSLPPQAATGTSAGVVATAGEAGAATGARAAGAQGPGGQAAAASGLAGAGTAGMPGNAASGAAGASTVTAGTGAHDHAAAAAPTLMAAAAQCKLMAAVGAGYFGALEIGLQI